MRSLFFILVFCLQSSLQAATFNGLVLADSVSPHERPKLHLLGAATRTKFFFDIYVGSFYASKTLTSPEQALKLDTAQRMALVILYQKISAKQFRDAWLEGIRNNNDARLVQHQAADLEAFLGLFTENLQKDDQIIIDFDPSSGTDIRVNQNPVLHLPAAFYPLLLRTWLGPNPPDPKFKHELFKALK